VISVITPWRNGADTLLGDYAAAVQGCEVVTVDNGSDQETAQALQSAGGIYIRNETNAGFAAANNQGYARASGDIIIFLNSDVAPAGPWLAMVEANVKDGALYGPSLVAVSGGLVYRGDAGDVGAVNRDMAVDCGARCVDV
jgi:glycosyltransferase involved in cell wall biosynthesis